MKKPTRDRTMREHPDIEQLKRQAKQLLEAFIAAEPDAVNEVSTHFRGANPAKFALHDGVTVGRLCDAVERGDLPVVARCSVGVRKFAIWNGRGMGSIVHCMLPCRAAMRQ